MPCGPYMLAFQPVSRARRSVNEGRKRGVTKPAARKPRRNRRKP